MRTFGTVLLTVGAFIVLAALLELAGPTLRAEGIEIFGNVTSVPGALAVGALLALAGALLRKKARR